MLTTPPGTSDVARTSLSVTAGSGRVSEVRTHDRVPRDERRREPADTSPSSDDVSGATMPTTPVGSGIVKLKYGAATGFDEPSTWAILSAQPAYQTQRSIARSTTSRAFAGAQPLGGRDLGDELVAPALHQLGDAVQDLAAVHRRPVGPAGWNALRAARTASRRSLREARQAFASGVAVGGADDVRAAALGPRERAADVQLVGLADLDRGRPPVSGPRAGRRRAGRACRPRARSPIPCSRRTARSGRTG